jgi:hypothetical protein
MEILCITIATNLQTIIDGGWNGQIFPNRKCVTKIYVMTTEFTQIDCEMAFVEQETS